VKRRKKLTKEVKIEKKKNINEELENIEKELAKAVENDENWMVVKGGSKVILTNEDELTIKPVKKAKTKK